MDRTRLGLAATMGLVFLSGTGCHMFGNHCSNTSSRNEAKNCSAPSNVRMAPANCDPTLTSFGQPGMVYSDAPVGAQPTVGTPFPGRPENELPFPQTIAPPGVPPYSPQTNNLGRNAFEAGLPK